MPNLYQIGSEVQLQGTFVATETGDTVDPTQISLYLQDPTGTEQTLTYAASQLVRASQGVYTYTLDVTISGQWRYQFQGAGAVNASTPVTRFFVAQSPFIAG